MKWLRCIGFPLSLLILSVPQSTLAWDSHHIITAAALSDVTYLKDLEVTYTPFERLLEDLQITDAGIFNKNYLLDTTYRFRPLLQEKAGQNISLIRVLSKYSDEPDWGMDTELFRMGQYPELWRGEYKYMGGRKGTASQAFRHMYWSGFSFLKPFVTFKLPIMKIFNPMGEAPERSELFFSLALKAKETDHPYWHARFIANALHYVEDVTNPFHSSQTPTKKIILLPFTDSENGSGIENFVKQATQIVTYYHFAFEQYIGNLMKKIENGSRDPESQEFFTSLKNTEKTYAKFKIKSSGIKGLVKKLARYSSGSSDLAGRAAMEFFPKITVPFADLDPDAFMNEDWHRETIRRGRANSTVKKNYFKIVNNMFKKMGFAIREAVQSEFPNTQVSHASEF